MRGLETLARCDVPTIDYCDVLDALKNEIRGYEGGEVSDNTVIEILPLIGDGVRAALHTDCSLLVLSPALRYTS
jgi:hypothetical protein